MKPQRGATISADEAECVYQAVLQYTDGLEKYKSWLQTTEGKTLPGAEMAVAEVAKEITRYRALSMNLYRQCYESGKTQ